MARLDAEEGEAGDVEGIDLGLEAFDHGNHIEAETPLRDVVRNPPSDCRFVKRTGGQPLPTFWDLEEFTHDVTWTRGQDDGVEGRQKRGAAEPCLRNRRSIGPVTHGRASITNNNGQYMFFNLRAGTYIVSVSGFSPRTVTVATGQTLTVNFSG